MISSSLLALYIALVSSDIDYGLTKDARNSAIILYRVQGAGNTSITYALPDVEYEIGVNEDWSIEIKDLNKTELNWYSDHHRDRFYILPLKCGSMFFYYVRDGVCDTTFFNIVYPLQITFVIACSGEIILLSYTRENYFRSGAITVFHKPLSKKCEIDDGRPTALVYDKSASEVKSNLEGNLFSIESYLGNHSPESMSSNSTIFYVEVYGHLEIAIAHFANGTNLTHFQLIDNRSIIFVSYRDSLQQQKFEIHNLSCNLTINYSVRMRARIELLVVTNGNPVYILCIVNHVMKNIPLVTQLVCPNHTLYPPGNNNPCWTQLYTSNLPSEETRSVDHYISFQNGWNQVTCEANFEQPATSDSIKQYFYHSPSPSLIVGNIPDTIIETTLVKLECMSNIENVQWHKNGRQIAIAQPPKIHGTTYVAFEFRATISDVGNYSCVAYDDQDIRVAFKELHIPEVHPLLLPGSANNRMELELGEKLELFCLTEFLPNTTVIWYKDEFRLLSNEHVRLSVANISEYQLNHTLSVAQFNISDIGLYECSIGNATQTYDVRIRDGIGNIIWIIGFICALIICVFVFLYLRKSDHFSEKELRTFKYAGILHFEGGRMVDYETDRNLKHQADLLPYDRRYEFPRDRLLLSTDKLGSGAFGVVYKARAIGIVPHQAETTVAVKTIGDKGDWMSIKSLISELKIMMHMGKHVNIVNLLGAVTGDLRQRSLLVLIEFCDLGNSLDFLRNNRSSFVNQFDEVTETISSSVDSKPDAAIGDRPVTTTDLICWSFQAARGMTHLSQLGILHGDLAARNLLLCSDNVAKISDFGLSCALQPEEYYEKESDCRLPLKWLSIESLLHKRFNTQSDIWSFGILMWELFSLAKVPYSDVPNRLLLSRLQNGHRMLRPMSAPYAVYDLMRCCWSKEPEQRPKFGTISKILGRLLPVDVAQRFVDLNEYYLRFYRSEYHLLGDYLEILTPSMDQESVAALQTASSEESVYETAL